MLCKAVRQGRLTAKSCGVDATCEAIGTTYDSFGRMIEEAFVIAHKYGRSLYDSLYVALAVTYRATLVAADEKLANATAAYLPVKWIGFFK